MSSRRRGQREERDERGGKGERGGRTAWDITITIPHEKPEEWPPYLLYKLHHRYRAKDDGFQTKIFEISKGACSLMTRDMSCNQIRPTTFV